MGGLPAMHLGSPTQQRAKKASASVITDMTTAGPYTTASVSH